MPKRAKRTTPALTIWGWKQDAAGEMPFPADGQMEILLAGMRDKLRSEGFTEAEIRTCEGRLHLLGPGRNGRLHRDWSAGRAARACYFIRRFQRAWAAGDFKGAAAYAIEGARSATQSLELDARTMESTYSRFTRTKTSRNEKIMAWVEAKLVEKRGLASAKQLYNWLGLESGPVVKNLKTFEAILRRGNWRDMKGRIREKALQAAK